MIVAGDGIREDVTALGDLLQSHAGLRFVFGLVELELFDLNGNTLVVPRVLTQTTLLERGLVRLEQPGKYAGQITVDIPLEISDRPTRGRSVTEDEFFE